jgi:hypothetical protein
VAQVEGSLEVQHPIILRKKDMPLIQENEVQEENKMLC